MQLTIGSCKVGWKIRDNNQLVKDAVWKQSCEVELFSIIENNYSKIVLLAFWIISFDYNLKKNESKTERTRKIIWKAVSLAKSIALNCESFTVI